MMELGIIVIKLKEIGMSWCSPSTPKQTATTVLLFSVGVAFFTIGAHLSYVNIGPQRERTLARDNFVREYLRKKYGYGR
ncbi:hypothetical protein HPP92_012649 [Vanilla planifolia]|uniref:Uncharacterized protein n=1 Tax=Vanilla planifolia TaxID=51239 RepID=A0A835UVV5_VANPL|nr:hypothetical protein HPP92_012649 [Vanilla planifolia]